MGGLALGCILVSNGRKTCVLEARPQVARSNRGLTLQPNGLESLQRLGLLGNVVGLGPRISRVSWHEIGGSRLATLDYSILDHPYNYLLTVVPSDLELVLRKEFSRRGGMLLESTSFRGIIPDDFGRIVAKAEKNGASTELSTRIIIGADGENSSVRQALKIPARVKEYPDHFVFTRAGPIESLRLEARQYVARGKMMGLFPTQDSTYIFYYVAKKTFEEFKTLGLATFKKEISSIEPEASEALASVQSWEDVAFAVPRRVNVESWVADQAALLGDAAHALDPSLAQGANMAFQDTVALAETVERCFELGDFSRTTLAGYEKARRTQAEFIQRQAERTAKLTTTTNSFYYRLGKRILRRTGSNRELMRTALKASAGLKDHFSVKEQIRFLI